MLTYRMKWLVCIGLVLLASHAYSSSPYFSTDTEEVDSAEHGGPPGRRGTTCACGWSNKKASRIVGGKVTKVNEYPFQVALIDAQKMYQFCGGTIISPYHVMTAAHCTIDYVQKGGSILVAVGDHDLSSASETQSSRIIRVKTILQHSQYDHQIIRNDISILLLESKISFNQNVGPACLPTVQMNLENQYVRLTGWGRTAHTAPTSPVLKKVDLRIVPYTACARRHSNMNPYERTQICTHGMNRGACMGDSGGPLTWVDPETNRYTVVGVVSFGKICGSIDPSVYTDVGAFLPWIRAVISSYNPAPTCSKA